MTAEPTLCEGYHTDPTTAKFSLLMLDTTSLDALFLGCDQCVSEVLADWLADTADTDAWEIRRLAT